MEGILVFIAIVVLSAAVEQIRKRAAIAQRERTRRAPATIRHGAPDSSNDPMVAQLSRATAPDEPPYLPTIEEPHSQRPPIEKGRPQKPADTTNKEEKIENLRGNDYAIQSKEEARKAIIWSEVLRRKY